MTKRTKAAVFISYARRNRKLVNRFLPMLEEQLGPSKKYDYWVFDDSAILAGEDWEEEIEDSLKKASVGLLLISPAFLCSDYVWDEEVPALIEDKKRIVIPVMLTPVNFSLHDLKGLESLQIFQLRGDRLKQPKSFVDCSGNQRLRFVENLFEKIEKRLNKLN